MLRRAIVCLVLMTPVIATATPGSVPIQGTLLDASGNAVNGTRSITFNIYTVAAGGSAIYTETQPSVSVEYGVFTAYIGDVTPLSLSIFDGRNLWLGVTVGTDAEMTPRLRFGTVPYAAYAETGGSSIPSGAVMFFDGTACPPGWSLFPKAQGRTVVGLTSGGVLQGGWPTTFPGGGLTDQAPRLITQVPAHTHGISAQSTSSAGDHLHSVTTNVSVNAGGAHSHSMPLQNGGGGTTTALGWFNNSIGSTPLSTGSVGDHTHTVNNPAVSSSTAGAHTHTIAAFTSDSSGVASVDVTMPYVQLLPCRKN